MTSKAVKAKFAVAALVASMSLGACDKQPARQGSLLPPANAPSQLGVLQPAAPAGPKFDCSGVKPASAPPGSPPDDILGVRLGMTPKTVEAVLACGNPHYTITENDGASFNVPNIEHGPQPQTSVAAEDGDDKVEVVLLGLAGHEQAVRLTSQRRYLLGNQPSFPTEVAKLIAKYGPPTTDTGDSAGESENLYWLYDRSGKPLPQRGPAGTDCESMGGYGASFELQPECGLDIAADLTGSGDGGVSQRDVTVMNQADAGEMLDKEKAAIAIINAPRGAAGRL